MLVGTNIVRMVRYTLAALFFGCAPVCCHWMCYGILHILTYPACEGYVFKCSHVLRLLENYIVVDI